MAVQVKKDFLLKTMEERKLPFFTITDGRNLVGENQDEASVDKSIEMLTDILENVEENFVVIKLTDRTKKERAKGGRDFQYYEFKVMLKDKAAGINGDGINSTILSLMKQNSDILRQLEMQQKEHEIQALKDKLAAKETEDKPSPLIEAAIQALAGHFAAPHHPPTFKPVTGIAGADDAAVDENKVAVQQKIRGALSRLAKIDSQLPETLTMLADFAERKPDQYLQFRPMIKSMI